MNRYVCYNSVEGAGTGAKSGCREVLGAVGCAGEDVEVEVVLLWVGMCSALFPGGAGCMVQSYETWPLLPQQKHTMSCGLSWYGLNFRFKL